MSLMKKNKFWDMNFIIDDIITKHLSLVVTYTGQTSD